MRTVLLAAIHNGELERAPARVVIDGLCGEEIVQRVIEVVEQSPLSAVPDLSELVQWRCEQRRLERHWRAYLGTATVTADAASLAGEALYRGKVMASGEFAAKQWLARQVETFVTAKHIAAWRTFAQSSEDELLVLESDATLLPNSFTAVKEFVDGAVGGEPRYVNLAGGLGHDDIAIEHLVRDRTRTSVAFEKPVTNTSCAYMLNRPLVEALLAFLGTDTRAARLGIDWLFNAYFLDAARQGLPIACIHADPPALGHGSLTGVTRSWHPDR